MVKICVMEEVKQKLNSMDSGVYTRFTDFVGRLIHSLAGQEYSNTQASLEDVDATAMISDRYFTLRRVSASRIEITLSGEDYNTFEATVKSQAVDAGKEWTYENPHNFGNRHFYIVIQQHPIIRMLKSMANSLHNAIDRSAKDGNTIALAATASGIVAKLEYYTPRSVEMKEFVEQHTGAKYFCSIVNSAAIDIEQHAMVAGVISAADVYNLAMDIWRLGLLAEQVCNIMDFETISQFSDLLMVQWKNIVLTPNVDLMNTEDDTTTTDDQSGTTEDTPGETTGDNTGETSGE